MQQDLKSKTILCDKKRSKDEGLLTSECMGKLQPLLSLFLGPPTPLLLPVVIAVFQNEEKQ